MDSDSRAEELSAVYDGHLQYVDITQIKDCTEFIKTFDPEDDIIICGGDGTLNRFVNSVYDLKLPNKIYYYGTGTGNDFLRDLGRESFSEPFLINEYIESLPTVTVNGKTCRFINGIGFGIDGYCCEEGDRQRAEGKKPNYTAIAIKGLLFHYKPTSATVTVDGVTKQYKKVWIAPTMHGRFYGGGMMPAPHQDRSDPKHFVSFAIMHGAGKLRTLMMFPSIFKGEHIKHKNLVDEVKGHRVSVEFDRPVALQIDGETVLNVKKYEVVANQPSTADTYTSQNSFASV